MQLAQIHEELFASHDPYHVTFGTIACGETWLWQEDGFGLGMDVAMKEGYGAGVGLSPYQPAGSPTKHQLRSFPMTFEPLWSMPVRADAVSFFKTQPGFMARH